MFLLVVLAIWTGMHVYVFWRVATVPAIARRVPRLALIAIALFLWASYILARMLEHWGASLAGGLLEWLGATWLGVMFLVFFCLLAADVVSGFGFLLRRRASQVRGWALLAAGALSIVALVQGSRPPRVSSYDVSIAGLPAARDGTVIVLMSDLHLGSMLGERWLADRVQQVQAERPDLVLLAGDIIEGDDESENALIPALQHLSAPLGVWAVTGNHEFHGQARVHLLEQAGIWVLHDRWAEAAPGLVIAGVDDLTSRRRLAPEIDFVARALAGRPPGMATILLSHTPWQADSAARAGAGLMLSGHTHNGQIWPFNYMVAIFDPLLAGRYQVAGMPVIVCRGTGTWGPRMRLWSRGEILRITLHATAS